MCLSQTIGLHSQHDLFLSPGDPLLWDPWGIRSPDDQLDLIAIVTYPKRGPVKERGEADGDRG